VILVTRAARALLAFVGIMRNLARRIVDHNPFYLASALSMFAGCYQLSRALALAPGETTKLVALIAVLNVYEGLLIGLSIFLVVRRGLVRDGRMLLLLESAFLVDVALLASEVHASSRTGGSLVSGTLFLLAVLKIGAVARGLGVPSGPLFGLALPPLALLLAVPGLFAALVEARVLSLPVVYVFWWGLALLVVLQALQERRWPRAEPTTAISTAAATFRRALAVAPLLSLADHLIAAAWVQGLSTPACFFGPPLVALGIRSALLREPARPWWGSVSLPVAGLLLSLSPPAELVITDLTAVALSPLRATLVAAGLAYLVAFRLHRRRVFAWGGSLCLAGALLGHSVSAIAWTLGHLTRFVVLATRRVLPRTTAQWGLLAVVSSFVLLACGALASLLRTRTPEPPPPADA
jgi:hypothetical protein